MRHFIMVYGLVFVLCLGPVMGCSYVKGSIRSARVSVKDSMHSARASFPLKFFYRPSYETIGAMYKSDPVFAIELLERLCKNNADNLVYRLTLADMYRDRGRVNNAIRLWFEILWISEERGAVDGTNLQVYFIPIVPHQKEGIGPYGWVIDKSLAFANIGMIYFQNTFYQDASEYFSKAGDNASDPNRKAELYHQAGKAYGERGSQADPADTIHYQRQALASYQAALATDFSDAVLREEIIKSLSHAEAIIGEFEGRTAGPEISDQEDSRVEPL